MSIMDGRRLSPRPARVTQLVEAALLTVGVVAVIVLLAAVVGTRRVSAYAPVLTLAVGVVVTVAAVAALQGRHRVAEPWLAKLMALAFAAKLAGVAARWWVFSFFFDGGGDADTYNDFAVRFATAFEAGIPLPALGQYSGGTQALAQLAGWTYVVVGSDIIAGFLVFGGMGFWGAYLWYRAFAMTIPELDRRVAFVMVMLLPSVVFWPSSLGKEAPMMLSMGLMVFGLALMVERRWAASIPPILLGALLSLAIRPHIVAIVAAAAVAAIVLGRAGGEPAAPGQLRIGRVVASIVMLVAAGSVMGVAAEYLGLEELSVDAVEERLATQAEDSTQGGSSFGTGQVSLSPVTVPFSIFTLLFRPHLLEASSSLQAVSALENMALFGVFLLRWRSVGAAVRLLRKRPLILFALLATVFYAVALSSFGNFGLLMRQRSLILPAVALFVAIRPAPPPVVESTAAALRSRRVGTVSAR